MHAQQLLDHGPVSQADVRESLRLRRAIKREIKGYVERLAEKRIAAGDKPEVARWLDAAEGMAAPVIHRSREFPEMRQAAQIAAAPVGYDHVADSFFEED